MFKKSSCLLNIGRSVKSGINEGWRVCPEAEVVLEAVMRRPMRFLLRYVVQRRRKKSIGFFELEHAKRFRFTSYFFFRGNTVG